MPPKKLGPSQLLAGVGAGDGSGVVVVTFGEGVVGTCVVVVTFGEGVVGTCVVVMLFGESVVVDEVVVDEVVDEGFSDVVEGFSDVVEVLDEVVEIVGVVGGTKVVLIPDDLIGSAGRLALSSA